MTHPLSPSYARVLFKRPFGGGFVLFCSHIIVVVIAVAVASLSSLGHHRHHHSRCRLRRRHHHHQQRSYHSIGRFGRARHVNAQEASISGDTIRSHRGPPPHLPFGRACCRVHSPTLPIHLLRFSKAGPAQMIFIPTPPVAILAQAVWFLGAGLSRDCDLVPFSFHSKT